MRKWITTTAVAVLALALASVALAKFSQVANVTLTAHKGGQSTGINANLHSSDATAIGQKPKSAAELVITFPGRNEVQPTDWAAPDLYALGQAAEQRVRPVLPVQEPDRNRHGGCQCDAGHPPPNGRVKAYIAGANKIVLVITPTLGA
jgi:hypothetical protein